MAQSIFLDRDRRRLERAADHYLRMCYRMRTAARVTEFAGFLGYAQSYLTRRVAALTGLKVGDFLRQRQLPYGAYLLVAAPNRSVKDVAIASAFGTVSTFHRVFKAAYGISPAQ